MTDRLGKITRCYTIRYDRHSKHSPSRLWAAITRADEVSAWMDYPAKIDLRVGGEWHVDFGRTGDGELAGVIVRVEPEKVLTYAWGLSMCEWTITPASDGCDYTFVHAGRRSVTSRTRKVSPPVGTTSSTASTFTSTAFTSASPSRRLVGTRSSRPTRRCSTRPRAEHAGRSAT